MRKFYKNMIQNETLVKITDNAGGTVGKVFKILGSSKKRYASLGEIVIISVKVASPRKAVKKKDADMTSPKPSTTVEQNNRKALNPLPRFKIDRDNLAFPLGIGHFV